MAICASQTRPAECTRSSIHASTQHLDQRRIVTPPRRATAMVSAMSWQSRFAGIEVDPGMCCRLSMMSSAGIQRLDAALKRHSVTSMNVASRDSLKWYSCERQLQRPHHNEAGGQTEVSGTADFGVLMQEEQDLLSSQGAAYRLWSTLQFLRALEYLQLIMNHVKSAVSLHMNRSRYDKVLDLPWAERPPECALRLQANCHQSDAFFLTVGGAAIIHHLAGC